MTTYPGSTAFPRQDFYNEKLIDCSEGLTKRELLAGLALVGILAKHGSDDDLIMANFATDAVRAADALIEALNREEE